MAAWLDRAAATVLTPASQKYLASSGRKFIVAIEAETAAGPRDHERTTYAGGRMCCEWHAAVGPRDPAREFTRWFLSQPHNRRMAFLRENMPEAASGPLDDGLRALQSVLNGIRSDGPLMDSMTAEGPWWTSPDPTGVRLHDAIIEASRAVDAALADTSDRRPSANDADTGAS